MMKLPFAKPYAGIRVSPFEDGIIEAYANLF